MPGCEEKTMGRKVLDTGYYVATVSAVIGDVGAEYSA